MRTGTNFGQELIKLNLQGAAFLSAGPCVKAADGWPVLIFPFPVWPQAKFGIDEQGVITDQTAHTAALAEVVANAKKSWPELLGADAAHAKCGLVLL